MSSGPWERFSSFTQTSNRKLQWSEWILKTDFSCDSNPRMTHDDQHTGSHRDPASNERAGSTSWFTRTEAAHASSRHLCFGQAETHDLVSC